MGATILGTCEITYPNGLKQTKSFISQQEYETYIVKLRKMLYRVVELNLLEGENLKEVQKYTKARLAEYGLFFTDQSPLGKAMYTDNLVTEWVNWYVSFKQLD